MTSSRSIMIIWRLSSQMYPERVFLKRPINGELFGTELMVQALNEKGDAAPYELLPHVKTRVDEFVGDAPQFDDLTMLGIKWLGTAHR